MSTNISQIVVGIDISKDFLDIHLNPIDEDFQVTNNAAGFKKLIKRLSKYEVIQIGFEATGGYETLLSKELSKAGYVIWCVEPKRIRAFIFSEGIRAKTDKIDAKMIALFVSNKRPKYGTTQLSEDEERLRALIKRRADLMQMIVMERNRAKHPAQTLCKERIIKHIGIMKDEVKEIEQEIGKRTANNDLLKKNTEIITSIPGVGKVTAAILIAGLPELGTASEKEIASLAGLAPVIQQSGSSKGMATIKGGRSTVRNALYMAAVVAIRFNPTLKTFYERLRKKGKKCFKVAIVAVMRKLIIMLNAMVKNGEPWRRAQALPTL
jgi:transposase